MDNVETTENAASGGTCAADGSIPGMTLRDWFAGMVLAGSEKPITWGDADDFDQVAKECYWVADAMMKVRESNS